MTLSIKFWGIAGYPGGSRLALNPSGLYWVCLPILRASVKILLHMLTYCLQYGILTMEVYRGVEEDSKMDRSH